MTFLLLSCVCFCLLGILIAREIPAARADFAVLFSPGVIQAQGSRCLRLNVEHLLCHVAINGGTGRGKTKLIEKILEQAIALGVRNFPRRIGFMYVTPHPDAAREILDRLILTGVNAADVVYLKPCLEILFAIDPFTSRRQGETRDQYESRLRATCRRIFSAFVRNLSAAEQEMVKRLKRWFTAAAFFCGLDMAGEHLGLSALPSFFDPESDEFQENISRIRPFAKSWTARKYLRYFEKLAATPQARQQEMWVESSINLAEEIFSPLVHAMFKPRESIDFRQIILQGKFVIVDVSDTDDLSRDEGNVVGGILINLLIDAARRILEDDRETFLLVIDECENFIGEDIRRGFAELRKFKLILIIAFQDLSCLMKGDLDLVNRVISQCGLQFTFQQQSPDDVEYLAKVFGYGNLDLTPLLVKTAVHRGYRWVPTQSISYSEQNGWTVTEGQSLTESISKTEQQNTSIAINNQVGLSISQALAHGRSQTLTKGQTDGRGKNWNWKEDEARNVTRTRSEVNGETSQESQTRGTTDSQNHSAGTVMRECTPLTKNESNGTVRASQHSQGVSRGKQHSENRGESEGRTITIGKGGGVSETHAYTLTRADGSSETATSGVTLSIARGNSITNGSSRGESTAVAHGKTTSNGKSGGTAKGVTYQWVPLADMEIIEDTSGRLRISIEDQLGAIMNIIGSLPQQMVLVKVIGMKSPFILKVHDVIDPYLEAGLHNLAGDRRMRDEFRRQFIERVYAAHPFYFVPEVEENSEPDEPVIHEEENLLA